MAVECGEFSCILVLCQARGSAPDAAKQTSARGGSREAGSRRAGSGGAGGREARGRGCGEERREEGRVAAACPCVYTARGVYL